LTEILTALVRDVIKPLKVSYSCDRGGISKEVATMKKDIEEWLQKNGLNTAMQERLFEKIVKCKFLNGDCNFNAKEKELLENWFLKEGPVKMRTFYQKHILLGFPLKRISYNANSDLLKIFRKLKT
jgi:hypothetical protein